MTPLPFAWSSPSSFRPCPSFSTLVRPYFSFFWPFPSTSKLLPSSSWPYMQPARVLSYQCQWLCHIKALQCKTHGLKTEGLDGCMHVFISQPFKIFSMPVLGIHIHRMLLDFGAAVSNYHMYAKAYISCDMLKCLDPLDLQHTTTRTAAPRKTASRASIPKPPATPGCIINCSHQCMHALYRVPNVISTDLLLLEVCPNQTLPVVGGVELTHLEWHLHCRKDKRKQL